MAQLLCRYIPAIHAEVMHFHEITKIELTQKGIIAGDYLEA